jgi:hypothetical protein
VPSIRRRGAFQCLDALADTVESLIGQGCGVDRRRCIGEPCKEALTQGRGSYEVGKDDLGARSSEAIRSQRHIIIFQSDAAMPQIFTVPFCASLAFCIVHMVKGMCTPSLNTGEKCHV